jgi:CheY-like chemotaxis protein
MKSPLHILHLEDDPNDAQLIRSALEFDGITSTILRVQTRNEFVSALEGGGIDLIFSHFDLPAFNGLSAAEIVQTRWPAIPLILAAQRPADR